MEGKKHLFSFIYIVITTVLFSALSFVFCNHTYTYMEHWRTFFYDATYLFEQVQQVGGFSRLMADFLCQFFIHPAAGILINAMILALIAFEMHVYLSRIAWSNRLYLLAILPALALFYAHTRNNYLYEGTIGIFLMLICLNLRQKISNKYVRRVYTIIATILLYWLAGPIVMLFALTILVSRFSPFAFFPFAISFLLAGISLRLGHQGDLLHLLSPHGSYVLGIAVNSTIAWMPWILWLAILSLGLTIRHYRIPQWITKNLIFIQLILVTSFTIAGSKMYIDQKNETFKKLQTLCREERWNEVIQECNNNTMDNLLFVNCLNQALAETHQLDKKFKRIRGASYECLMVEYVASAYISAMISDIYYSMGYISQSQLSAFETNQQMRNLSPRMLQRLIKTNLIYGEYRVAEKYMNWLDKTYYYSDWVAHYRPMLNNDQAIENDPELGNKRRCLPEENFFTGSVSKIDALERIAKQNPAHKSTSQYLDAIYQLR